MWLVFVSLLAAVLAQSQDVKPVFKIHAKNQRVDLVSYLGDIKQALVYQHKNTSGLICSLLCMDDETCLGFNFNGRTDLHDEGAHCEIVPKHKTAKVEPHLKKQSKMNFFKKIMLPNTGDEETDDADQESHAHNETYKYIVKSGVDCFGRNIRVVNDTTLDKCKALCGKTSACQSFQFSIYYECHMKDYACDEDELRMVSSGSMYYKLDHDEGAEKRAQARLVELAQEEQRAETEVVQNKPCELPFYNPGVVKRQAGSDSERHSDLLMDYQMPSGGKIVGWKFWCEKVKPASSYVSVWRSTGWSNMRYKLVQKTKLECDKLGLTEILLRKAIRVRRDDFLGILHDAYHGSGPQSVISRCYKGKPGCNTSVLFQTARKKLKVTNMRKRSVHHVHQNTWTFQQTVYSIQPIMHDLKCIKHGVTRRPRHRNLHRMLRKLAKKRHRRLRRRDKRRNKWWKNRKWRQQEGEFRKFTVIWHKLDSWAGMLGRKHLPKLAIKTCQKFGTRLATTHELVDAWHRGYDKCACGMVADRTELLYPINSVRSGCDNKKTPGVRVCPKHNRGGIEAYKNGFGAFCVDDDEKVRQSSTTWGGLAKRAHDGDDDTNYWGASCSHTNYYFEPWWYTRLDEGSRLISEVTITNRHDCCSNRLHKFDIAVVDHPPPVQYTDSQLCAYEPGTQDAGAKTYKCTKTLTGRYLVVKFRYDGTMRIMTLCEVAYK